MEQPESRFDIEIIVEDDHLTVVAAGIYSLRKANDLFKLAVDHGLLHESARS